VKIKLKWIVLVLLLVGLASCRSGPVANIVGVPVAPQINQNITIADVEKAMIRAGVSLGWAMIPESPGHLVGTLILRTHRVVVDVTFDTQSYSIMYKDSYDMDYDGVNIHSNYNSWVGNLKKSINLALVSL